MTKTQLAIEYYDRTKKMEFSEELDTLLEKDYVKDPAFYSDKVFDFLLVNDSILGINPDENIAAAKEKFG